MYICRGIHVYVFPSPIYFQSKYFGPDIFWPKYILADGSFKVGLTNGYPVNRAGMASMMAAAGCRDETIMRQGRWNSR